MQIVRLLPDQCMDNWHFIKDSIEKSFPPIAIESTEALLSIQQQLLLGEMMCWFGIESLESQEIVAVMTTKVVFEEATNTKNMLIFSLTSYQLHSMDLWNDGYYALAKYARSLGCNKIISFTDNPQVVHIAEKLGANTSWKLIQLDI